MADILPQSYLCATCLVLQGASHRSVFSSLEQGNIVDLHLPLDKEVIQSYTSCQMNTNESPFEQPSVTVDVLIFTINADQLNVLLIKRATRPYKGSWSIPGGFLHRGESLEQAALRVALEKTGVKDIYLEQLYTFGDPDRDPRARIVTVTYVALIPWKKLERPSSERVSDIAWFPINELPSLAFDHKHIVEYGLARLKAKITYSNIVYALLPERFRLSDLQKIHEVILGKPLDKRNFRKRLLSLDVLVETGEKEITGAHRPAMLYSFKTRDLVFFD